MEFSGEGGIEKPAGALPINTATRMLELRALHAELCQLRARGFQLCLRLRNVAHGGDAAVITIFGEL